MSQFGKKGGGQHFSKMSQIQKCPKGRKGGWGSTLIWTLSQIFLNFYFDASPKPNCLKARKILVNAMLSTTSNMRTSMIMIMHRL